ncbi:polyprotein [Scorzonera virus A]|uniref:Genome polyprotein n=1 Tax=Scorzonera virus A TaxID=2871166 RepID=A0ABX9AFY6_9POTV|nr:polyprotein [Scorzonera virus A]QZH54995.1 polyprotein [Scorzonera virus A]
MKLDIPIPDMKDFIPPNTPVEKQEETYKRELAAYKTFEHAFVFGQFKCEITGETCKLSDEPVEEAPTKVSDNLEEEVKVQPQVEKGVEQSNETNTYDPFETLNFQLKEKFEKRKNLEIIRDRAGNLTYGRKEDNHPIEDQTHKAGPKRAHAKAKSVKEQDWVSTDPVMVITNISIGGGAQPSSMEEEYTEKQVHATSKKATPRRTFKKVEAGTRKMEYIMQQIMSIARKSPITIQYIDKKQNGLKCKVVNHEGHKILKVETVHERGKKLRCDLSISSEQRNYLTQFAQRIVGKRIINCDSFGPGTSGFVLPMKNISGNTSKHAADVIVVRGRLNGKLVSSLDRFKLTRTHRIIHYSSTGERFFNGFSNTFVTNRPKDIIHVCESDFSVEDCGVVAALLTQTIFQVGKITCKKCANEFAELTDREIGDRTNREIDNTIQNMQIKLPQFTHAIRFLKAYRQFVNLTNPAVDVCIDVQRKIGSYKEAPFTHISKVNEVLMKGGSLTSDDLASATKHLQELARFQLNRTDNIAFGDLKNFRNKISAKTRINPVLMCDNQLDANGKFVWGERGRHAKRFFTNFYKFINPTDGYKEYEIRRFPNGSRKLAIGNLIISTNLANIRKQLEGESVGKMDLTEECISKRSGKYLYSACCVTHDDGTPMLSQVRMPTKNHLAIGNSGDTKYVDLPTDESLKMYIAEDGYCYVNIFLAMLVDVPEQQAKDFTKMARDDVISVLGKWPKLTDVATYCYFLSVFFPDVHKAELPRILVDHNTKTMHVLDSFGSITTGYHILKASTVSQLIDFAYETLDSPMKHYQVGGTNGSGRQVVVEAGRESFLKLLIKGIYRPRILKQIIENEPYTLVLGVVSPSIMIAMYNSGTYERALQQLINTDQSVTTIIKLMARLTEKITVAKTLDAQVNLIEQHAAGLRDAITSVDGASFSQRMAKMTLDAIASRNESNTPLVLGGFRVLQAASNELMEKKYLQDLQASWEELNLLEKWSSIRQSRVERIFTTSDVEEIPGIDISGKQSSSMRVYFTTATSGIARKFSSAKTRIYKAQAHYTRTIFYKTLGIIYRSLPEIVQLLNIVLVFNVLLSMYLTVSSMVEEYKQIRYVNEIKNRKNRLRVICTEYEHLKLKYGEPPTREELQTSIVLNYPDFAQHIEQDLDHLEKENISLQAKRKSEADLERVIAFVALVMMLFDAERSDGVYRTLCKLKGLMGCVDQDVVLQSLDTIQDTLEEKKQTIDFEVTASQPITNDCTDSTFEKWWSNQLQHGNTIPQHWNEGQFLEFSRATAADVAYKIIHDDCKDFLVRGAVGSGKSTGLPFHLQKKGPVLLLEPTRPLAINVYKQLSGEPFHINATLRMRGLSQFGASPVHIMTNGFALHYFANNTHALRDFDFIIFDECHVMDANSMAFRCLLSETSYAGKILKVSATPPGREVAFKTQHSVKLVVEENLSMQQFAQGLGSGALADATQYGSNVLVYVASYNDVDQLSKMVIDKGYKVTKVDGRTMKLGNTEIETTGTKEKPHFVIATNIIENGVTLDIEVVVDFGMKVQPVLMGDERMVVYQKVPVTYGERIQRLGRVGRHKPGTAIRIGSTTTGPIEVPPIIATEAALMSFAYGLPVMTGNVSVGVLAKCTVRQARTMSFFELPVYYTNNLVKGDGTMHPVIHSILKPYKLRDSEVVLLKTSIPHARINTWHTVREYRRLGCRLNLDDDVRIPFVMKDIPERIHEEVWDAVQKYKNDFGFGRCKSANVAKIAYTLKTDKESIFRTLAMLDALIAQERRKKAMFDSAASTSMTVRSMSLVSLVNAVRSRYDEDFSGKNIERLQALRDCVLNWMNGDIEVNEYSDHYTFSKEEFHRSIEEEGALETILLQSTNEISDYWGLKGRWNKSLLFHDLLIVGGVAIGGACMIYSYFKQAWNEPITLQGKSKRHRQKLKFREARDRKIGLEVYGEDSALGETFGSAYTKKGKGKGTTHGQGKKNRKFINMYGYDPADYQFVRFVDPLTGYTIDDSPYVDIQIVQEEFGKKRMEKFLEGEVERQAMDRGIEAYYIKDLTSKALKIDLTPHNPLAVGKTTNNIAGFPEREKELRQTGPAQVVAPNMIPSENKMDDEEEEVINLESKAIYRGVRDYNPIATSICRLKNDDGLESRTIYGIGYGCMIITNQHLFKFNNGSLTIQSHHGEFTIQNTCTLRVRPIDGRDMIIIRLPKDFPPFPQKLRFREPKKSERVCMVSSIFQAKSITSAVSEPSTTIPATAANMWIHYIDSKNGQCGLPMVSPTDGEIVGIHCAASQWHDRNFYVAFDNDFKEKYLEVPDNNDWVKQWKFNKDNIAWGELNVIESQPTEPFKITKLIKDLFDDDIRLQSGNERWFASQLNGNLKAVAHCPSQLVTKHVVKGRCMLFTLYLQENPDAMEYFTPLMGKYQKSRLNREAFTKDIMKYSSTIPIGNVECDVFEQAVESTKRTMEEAGFTQCEFITDPETIYNALNLKSAVGALYGGKKKDYFKDWTMDEFGKTLEASCERLYTGKFGVWTGSLKAELRPLEKVEANKTRVFTAAPLDTLLSGKVCVDDFNTKFYGLNIKAPWTVGMTKFFGGWNELLESLPDNWVYCDADGSQFDSSLTPYLLNAVLNIRLDFMEDWELGKQMLKNLYTEITYTAISTPDSTIVKKFKGNNSGQPSTVVDNTLMVILAMKYTLLKNGVKHEQQNAMCRYFVNGDDLLIAIEPSHEYMLDTFQECFASLGLKYDFSTRTRDKSDLWFMSHVGIKRDGMYIPKLEPERIVSILEWDRSQEPAHRLEAICAAMIEAWGYDKLVHEIRKFYSWVLEQEPYKQLATEGKAPYISEAALRRLYTGNDITHDELMKYLGVFSVFGDTCGIGQEDIVLHALDETGDVKDAGTVGTNKSDNKKKNKEQQPTNPSPSDVVAPEAVQPIVTRPDRDVNVGTTGTHVVPRIKQITGKLKFPKYKGNKFNNLEHLLEYKPDQVDISNTRATREQFDAWVDGIKNDYEVSDENMQVLLNGLMVWCIENGTSPNINGTWTMMDGEEQVSYSLKPVIEHARPTLRQIMAHFSDLAEAYIVMRNQEKPYMPRYGIQRNLRDMSLARIAFDFYEVTSATSIRAKEAHHQMKIAALHNSQNKMFGIDGGSSIGEENTERHTAADATRNTHTMQGMLGMI